ncbi:hypothetical protein HDK77DRAFT_438293 [Phyllosticta capitalensis]
MPTLLLYHQALSLLSPLLCSSRFSLAPHNLASQRQRIQLNAMRLRSASSLLPSSAQFPCCSYGEEARSLDQPSPPRGLRPGRRRSSSFDARAHQRSRLLLGR